MPDDGGNRQLNDIGDHELIRSRWRRALEKLRLDRADRDDFALGGLADRVRTVTVQLAVLPADPEKDWVTIDGDFWPWFDQQKAFQLHGRRLDLGEQVRPTAHAAALVNGYETGQWRSYFAVHRNGMIEVGVGDRGGWERRSPEGETVRQFNLVSVVAHTIATLKLLGAVNARSPLPSPLLLAVGFRATHGAVLGNLAEGWAEPHDFENRVGGCFDGNLVWHIELGGIPTEEEAETLAVAVGDRIETAWGVTQSRHLARRGDLAGRLDLRSVTNR
jgi:hypothetical protein